MFRPFLQRSRGGPIDYLVVFLGNPGGKYENTRHNAGFRAGDATARRCGVSFQKLKFHALCADAHLGGSRVCYKPQTFMISGTPYGKRLFLTMLRPAVCRRGDVPFRALRIRAGGSAGGHNGLKHIIASLGTEAFPRIKIGVGSPPHPAYDMVDWVLGVPAGEDQKAVEEAVSRVSEAIEEFLSAGIDRAMNKYN